MKTIHLIRHAKSSWENTNLSDENRPLSFRGVYDCQLMAPTILEAGWHPVHIFTSKAVRAQLTITGIADALSHKNISWLIDDKLYTFSADSLVDWIEHIDDEINEVTLVGHNPAMTQLINQVSDRHINNFPTCAYAQLHSMAYSWKQVFSTQLQLLHYIKPKMLKK